METETGFRILGCSAVVVRLSYGAPD